MEGIEGVASSTGARGTPGLEGYPGVDLEGQFSLFISGLWEHTDHQGECSETLRFHAEQHWGYVQVLQGKVCTRSPRSFLHHHQGHCRSGCQRNRVLVHV